MANAAPGATKRLGRPKGFVLNSVATRELIEKAGLPIYRVAELAKISDSHLREALNSEKGLPRLYVERLAVVLGCAAGTIAPEMTGAFIPTCKVA